MPPTDPPSPSTAWWLTPDGGIRRTLAGVFEGGGSKGLLYVGALQAVRDQGCWFDAVAGASAGAITAAMIASGMTPEEIAARAEAGLEVMALPGTLNGLLRVRAGVSLLDQEALERWLRDVLEGQVFGDRSTLERFAPDRTLDFRTLWEATGIELDVVAIDLARERHVVFNHHLTPGCEVVRAVTASAAIPFAFEWVPLEVPGEGDRTGIVVDGGVAANFPAFVFTDPSFRAWAGLPPQRSPVVGFLLDEPGEEMRPDAYIAANLAPPVSRHRRHPPFRRRREPGLLARALKLPAWPLRILWWPFGFFFFKLVPGVLERNGSDVGIPSLGAIPKGRIGSALRFFDRVLLGAYNWGIFLGAFLVITLALGLAAFEMGVGPFVDIVRDWRNGELGLRDGLLGAGVSVGVITVCVHAWVVLMSVFSMASLVHRNVRVLGYGLLQTFLWGSGAPPWVGHAAGDHVVKLQVPPGVGLLRVDDGVDLDAAVAGIRESAARQLDDILRQL